jgi:hypothetical protein
LKANVGRGRGAARSTQRKEEARVKAGAGRARLAKKAVWALEVMGQMDERK